MFWMHGVLIQSCRLQSPCGDTRAELAGVVVGVCELYFAYTQKLSTTFMTNLDLDLGDRACTCPEVFS